MAAGFDFKIDFIRLAHEDGLGVRRVEGIEVLGEDISGMNFHFSVGDNLASHVGDLFWYSSLKKLQKFFFHTPLVYLFVLGSYIYHDGFWWPLVGKRLMEVVEANTEWGKFLANYPN